MNFNNQKIADTSMEASNTNQEVFIENETGRVQTEIQQTSLKQSYSIKDLAKSVASHNLSSIKMEDVTCPPGYEQDFEENKNDQQELEEDKQDSPSNDDSGNEPEDPQAPDHEIKTQKINGKILQAEFSKGLKQGMTSIKTKEGFYEMQANYVKGKLDGLTTYHYPNGKIEREINFKQGKMHGLMKAFHENGKLAMEVEYEHGLMHGTSKVYDEFGKEQVVSNYQKGKLHGDTVVYSNGKPYLKKVYHEGQETHQEYDASCT